MARVVAREARIRVGRTRLDVAYPQPASDYQSALEKFAQLQLHDGEGVNGVCRSRLLSHNARTPSVVVLLHGITNCPEQYAQLAPELYRLGYNVLVPRIPRNGLADRMTEELRLLTAAEMREYADGVVDIAAGLGESVTVMGLSGGGVIAGWMAQFRREVDSAIVIAPAIGIVASLGFLNASVNRLMMRAMLRLPNLMTRRVAAYDNGISHTYMGFATRGLGAMMQLGFATLDAARQRAPLARRMTVVVNDNDRAISNVLALRLARRWRVRRPDAVSVYRFPTSLGLLHDVIDPQQKDQQTERVYPVLLDLLTPASEVGD
jgi:pimeloyl-ACP methyl ester carboxylesterase